MLPKEAKVATPNHSVPGRAVLAEGLKPAERQRGSWSFLTWSFFLAQMVAAEQFLGSGARAAQTDDASATRANESQISSDEAVAGAKWGSAGHEDGQSGTIDQQVPLNGAHGIFPGASQSAGGTQSASVSPDAVSVSPPSGSGGSGGDSSIGSGQPLSSQGDSQPLADAPIAPASELSASPPHGPLPSSGEPLDNEIEVIADVDIGPDPELDLNLGLDLDPLAETGLGLDLGLGDVGLNVDLDLGPTLADSLAFNTGLSLSANLSNADASLDLGLELGGASPLLNPSADQNQSTQGVIPVADGVVASIISNPTDLSPLQQGGAVSSGEAIAFSAGTASKMGDDLFTSGRYTDYSLALHSDDSLGAGEVIDHLDADILDKGMSSLNDSPDDTGASAGSRSTPGDVLDTSHLGLPSTAEELSRADAV